jgi:hypothetical protein
MGYSQIEEAPPLWKIIRMGGFVVGLPELGKCKYRNFLAMEHDFLGKELFASGY